MFPGLSINNAPYSLDIDAVFFCQITNPPSFRIMLADSENNI